MGTPPGVGNDPALGALLTDYARTVVGTVGTILAALAAYGAWAMDWPLAFLAAAGVGVVAHTLQSGQGAGPRASFERRLLRSTGRIGPYVGLIGVALSVPSGRTGWAAGLLVVALASYAIRRRARPMPHFA